MKTPREVLLHRHQAADARLDQIRHDVVAQIRSAPTTHRKPLPFRALLTLWRELILPARRNWGGLAAAWVVIIALNLATRDDSFSAISQASQTAAATPETLQALKQQRLLYAELMGRQTPRPLENNQPNIPGPRSQRREETVTV